MTTTTEYQVSGMSCAHCETAVTEEVTAIPGVQGIEVSASTGRLLVVSSIEIDDAQVIAAVDEAGYRAVRSS
jgi:copper chaperone CopZ